MEEEDFRAQSACCYGYWWFVLYFRLNGQKRETCLWEVQALLSASSRRVFVWRVWRLLISCIDLSDSCCSEFYLVLDLNVVEALSLCLIRFYSVCYSWYFCTDSLNVFHVVWVIKKKKNWDKNIEKIKTMPSCFINHMWICEVGITQCIQSFTINSEYIKLILLHKV